MTERAEVEVPNPDDPFGPPLYEGDLWGVRAALVDGTYGALISYAGAPHVEVVLTVEGAGSHARITRT